CSEIHVDCRPDEERKKISGHLLVNKDHPQVIEIWNNVFIQFNRKKDGSLEPLPSTHVDTGMGLERLVRVIQNKQSNYDTDLFTGSIAATETITGKKYEGGDSKTAIAFRVIADHIRAIGFCIADGQLPSNTAAGYVIRRILRRAVRYYYSYLDYKQPLLFQLMPQLANQFAGVFPELQKQIDFVSRVVKEEEEAFLRTLDKGLKRIDDIIGSASGRIGGREAFELYDTYGFPLDLTRLIASENKLQVDEAGFDAEMLKQKDRSRAATAIDTGDWVEVHSNGQSQFLGYTLLETRSKLLRYRKVKAKGKEAFQLVLDKTPFYAESGGQTGDTGVLVFGDERISITDTKKENDLIIHFADQLPAHPATEILAKVDGSRRQRAAVHHTATHLLHAALRQVLGTHVAQKGSLVNSEYLRFDFSHFAKMTDDEIGRVEQLINEKIWANIPVVIREMPKEEALQLGAMALFGEKYGDQVRVVIIDPAYSVELCGGTHVGATGELGLFKIRQESAVAAGVRRIEGLAGEAAFDYINQQLGELNAVKEKLKHPKDVLKAIDQQQQDINHFRQHAEHLEDRILVGIRNELLHKDEIINGVCFVGSIVQVSSADALKKLCYDLRNNLNDYVAVLCANIGGKPAVAVGIADTVVAARSLDAGKIIKEQVAPLVKGGGGGQKNLATAGGQDASRLNEVIAKVKSLLQ
ncbi:MAG TPA: alanine--tRNA ligase, partial [Chitinophagaceae bacterium]|nr:alanine--tRNA ligase [Chitinophagaceae bacterium]